MENVIHLYRLRTCVARWVYCHLLRYTRSPTLCSSKTRRKITKTSPSNFCTLSRPSELPPGETANNSPEVSTPTIRKVPSPAAGRTPLSLRSGANNGLRGRDRITVNKLSSSIMSACRIVRPSLQFLCNVSRKDAANRSAASAANCRPRFTQLVVLKHDLHDAAIWKSYRLHRRNLNCSRSKRTCREPIT